MYVQHAYMYITTSNQINENWGKIISQTDTICMLIKCVFAFFMIYSFCSIWKDFFVLFILSSCSFLFFWLYNFLVAEISSYIVFRKGFFLSFIFYILPSMFIQKGLTRLAIIITPILYVPTILCKKLVASCICN